MRRPHPATVIATIALAGVWVAPALSAALIDSGDVKNESLTGRDIRNRSITGADVRQNSITGGDVAGLTGRDLLGDSIDGFNVYEPGLDKVPAAERADSAAAADSAAKAGSADTVNGLRAAKVAWSRPAGTGNEEVLDIAGLKLRARCSNPARLEVEAIPAAAGGVIHVGYVRQTNETAPGYRGDDALAAGQAFAVLPAGTDNVQGSLTYLSKESGVVSFTFLADAGAGACMLAGTALGG